MSLREDLQPVDWNTVDIAIKEWIRLKLQFSDDRIQWENQDLPQPAYPYISLLRQSFIKEGDQGPDERRDATDLNQPLGEEIELTNTGPREFLLTVQAHSDEKSGANDPGRNAMFLASKLQSSLGQLSVVDRLKLAGISIIEEGAANDVSVTVNQIWTSKAAFDVRMRVVSVMTERVGFIDAIEGTGTLNPGPNEVTVDINVDVGTP